MQTSVAISTRYLWLRIWLGNGLLATGVAIDVLAGFVALIGDNLLWLPLHLAGILLSVDGLSRSLRGRSFFTLVGRWCRQTGTAERPASNTAVWLVFFIGLCTFPGAGLIACSLASAIIMLYQRRQSASHVTDHSVTAAHDTRHNVALPDLDIEPLVHHLYDGDLESRRAAIAELSWLGGPTAMQILRQLLMDPSPEVRHDAAITLTRLENELAQALDTTPTPQETSTPYSEQAYTLAEYYFRYAGSNVLDTASQRPYLTKAKELLTAVLTHDSHHLRALVLRARVQVQQGEAAEALHDILRALARDPASAELTVLAMEIAFAARAWEPLMALARAGLARPPTNPQEQQIMQIWASPPAGGVTLHG